MPTLQESQTIPTTNEDKPKDYSKEKANCEARGGTWNSETNTCDFKKEGGKTFNTGAGQVSKEVYEKEKRLTGTSKDPALERMAKEKTLSSAEALGLEKQPTTQEPQEEISQEIETALTTEEYQDERGLLTKINDYLSAIPTDAEGYMIDRKTGQQILNEQGEPTKVLSGTVPIGAGAGTGALLSGAPTLPASSGFLSNVATKGGSNIATKEVAKAPSILKTTLERARQNPIISAFVGVELVGTAKGIVSDVSLRNIKKLDQSLGKMGEQITSITATAQNGFYIDSESGQVKEYTTKDALRDLQETYEFTLEAEQKIKEANIYQKFFLLTSGEDISIMTEIEKLRSEVQEETSEIIQTQINQPDSLTSAKDFFRRLELEGYEIGK